MECRLVLSRNCRNTKSIAETSSKPIGLEKVKMRINLPGDITLYHNSKTKEELVEWLEKRIRYYTDNGVEKRQITILTLKTLSNSVLSDVKKIGSYSLVNEIDDKNITFTTARKFKGLEADVIFIVDIDADTFKNDENRRVFYVGASRAKSQLELISVLSDAEEKEMIYSLTKGTGRRRLLLTSNLKVKII